MLDILVCSLNTERFLLHSSAFRWKFDNNCPCYRLLGYTQVGPGITKLCLHCSFQKNKCFLYLKISHKVESNSVFQHSCLNRLKNNCIWFWNKVTSTNNIIITSNITTWLEDWISISGKPRHSSPCYLIQNGSCVHLVTSSTGYIPPPHEKFCDKDFNCKNWGSYAMPMKVSIFCEVTCKLVEGYEDEDIGNITLDNMTLDQRRLYQNCQHWIKPRLEVSVQWLLIIYLYYIHCHL
jgi:hypothetical protein